MNNDGPVRFVAGEVNQVRLQNLLSHSIDDCVRVRAAVAYAHTSNRQLFEACKSAGKALTYYGRYDDSLPVSVEILEWFLAEKSPALVCRLVPNVLHAKVIWWEGVGAYIGSANLTTAARGGNIEAGVFLEEGELVEQGIDEQLEKFFECVHEHSHELTKEVYEHLKKFRDGVKLDLNKAEHKATESFNESGALPRHQGLAFIHAPKAAQSLPAERFAKEWSDTLQRMRDLGDRLSLPENRPSWVKEDVPSGIQADQFLHRFYYGKVREGTSHPFDRFHQANKLRVDAAVKDAMAWWKSGDYDHTYEGNTIYVWAPAMRAMLSKSKLPLLGPEEFANLCGMVHAIRDHAAKQNNASLGLPNVQQTVEKKVEAFASRLYSMRSDEGKSPLETMAFVFYGGTNSELASRLWTATKSRKWKIPHLGVSSLGEMVGWALPIDFPPRNMRSSKSLRALGYDVEVHL
jgi:hypothetical protein